MSTYFGGSRTDWANDVVVDAAGNIYVVGFTNSTDFPVTPGGLSPEDPADCGVSIYDLCQDGFLLKLDSSGTLVFSTLLGGSSLDGATSVAVDGFGNVYVTGFTWSADFPTTPSAYQPTFRGGPTDVFVMKFDSAGGLFYSTFLGGSSGECRCPGISVDAFGNAYVSGITYSSDFPVTEGALRATDSGAFVVKLHPSGAALYYASIVGEGRLVTQITIDAEGSAYVTTTPFMSNESEDVLVYKLDPAGSGLEYVMSFGGNRTETPAAIAVDDSGRAYVTGYTTSEDFPTTPGAFDTRMDLDWHEEAFLTVLEPTGEGLAYSTFFGGVGDEFGNGVYVDGSGVVYLAGRKEFGSWKDTGGGFPTTLGAFDRTHNGGSDGFVAKLDLGGNLIYSTFLGGGDEALYTPFVAPYCNPCGDSIQSLAIDPTGNATVVGGTTSLDFPVTEGAFDVTHNGGPHDIFVLRIELIPEPNRAPVAYFQVRDTFDTDGRVLANASNSADAEDVDGLLEVRWDWENDGTWDTEWSTVKATTHAYSCTGAQTVRLEVRDTEGLTNRTTQEVDIAGGLPACPILERQGLLPSWTTYMAASVIAGWALAVPCMSQTRGNAPQWGERTWSKGGPSG